MSNEQGATSESPIPPAPDLDFYLFPEDVGRDDRVLKANFAFQQNGILTFGIDYKMLEANQNVIRQSVEEFANANQALLNQSKYSKRLEQWTNNGCILDNNCSISARNLKQFDTQVQLYMSGKCLLTHVNNAEPNTLLYINIQADLTVYPYGHENFQIKSTTNTYVKFDHISNDPNSIENDMREAITHEKRHGNQESKPKIFAISLEYQRWLEDKKKENIMYRHETDLTKNHIDDLRRYITSLNKDLLFQMGELWILNQLVFKDCFYSKTGNITKFYIAYSKQKYFREQIYDIAIKKLEYTGTEDQKKSEGEGSQIANILSWISKKLKEDKERILEYFFENFHNTYIFKFKQTPKQFLSLSKKYKVIENSDEREPFYDNNIDTICEIINRERTDDRAFSKANREEFNRRQTTLANHQNAGQLYANVYQKMNQQFMPQKRFAFIEFRIHEGKKGITYDYSIKPNDEDVIAT